MASQTTIPSHIEVRYTGCISMVLLHGNGFFLQRLFNKQFLEKKTKHKALNSNCYQNPIYYQ